MSVVPQPGAVKDNDRRWRELQRLFRGISAAHVTVGMHSDAAPYDRDEAGGAPNVAEVASRHEFGEGVPQRSFFRPTIDGNRHRYGALIERIARLLLAKKVSLGKGLRLIGLQVATDIKIAITDLDSPPLAESTKERKADRAGLTGAAREAYIAAGANPLIDTGHMRQSVTYDVVIDGKSADHPKRVPGGEGKS